MAAQGVERQQAAGQLVVLVMVGLGDQAQPRPQIALHLGACAFLPAGSLARWLAGTCGLCGGRRSCVAQHACGLPGAPGSTAAAGGQEKSACSRRRRRRRSRTAARRRRT